MSFSVYLEINNIYIYLYRVNINKTPMIRNILAQVYINIYREKSARNPLVYIYIDNIYLEY